MFVRFVSDVTALALKGNMTNCTLGNQSYPPGTAWYPYIPPNGFATCTVCQCDVSRGRTVASDGSGMVCKQSLYFLQHLNSQTKCSRVDCPPLSCDEKTAYRLEKDSCCKVCPNRTMANGFDANTLAGDQHNPVKYERDILAAGGCRYPYDGPYENGREWNPRLYGHGVERCVVCKCTVRLMSLES